jgi:glycosyltransferase involved in cell wall biosynthesis
MPPLVSVIIPCRNEIASIGRCLDSILASDYPRFEVLIADGRSTDGTHELIEQCAARDPRVRLIDNPQLITPAALNRAIAAAQGEIIARIDAHAAIAPDYISRAVHHLESSGADNVGGSMRTIARSPGPFAPAIVAVLTHRFGVGNSHFRVGTDQPRWVDTVFGGCWRRRVFDRIGLFNERLPRSQDMEFSLRLKAAGGKTLLAPEICSDYFARSDLASFWRHNFVNGEWAVLPFAYSDIIPVRARHLIPLAFVTTLAAALVLVPFSALPLAAAVFPYAVANLAASIHAAIRERRASLIPLATVAFASLHLSYGLGSLSGLAKLVRLTFTTRKVRECQPQS